jgi:hypothetical protein
MTLCLFFFGDRISDANNVALGQRRRAAGRVETLQKGESNERVDTVA